MLFIAQLITGDANIAAIVECCPDLTFQCSGGIQTGLRINTGNLIRRSVIWCRFNIDNLAQQLAGNLIELCPQNIFTSAVDINHMITGISNNDTVADGFERGG